MISKLTGTKRPATEQVVKRSYRHQIEHLLHIVQLAFRMDLLRDIRYKETQQHNSHDRSQGQVVPVNPVVCCPDVPRGHVGEVPQVFGRGPAVLGRSCWTTGMASIQAWILGTYSVQRNKGYVSNIGKY